MNLLKSGQLKADEQVVIVMNQRHDDCSAQQKLFISSFV
uniref:Transposase n=1 Tax=Heterorhabditis bacteriophora TaxID=37862 RepID=A0A1I7X720_HETBA